MLYANTNVSQRTVAINKLHNTKESESIHPTPTFLSKKAKGVNSLFNWKVCTFVFFFAIQDPPHFSCNVLFHATTQFLNLVSQTNNIFMRLIFK